MSHAEISHFISFVYLQVSDRPAQNNRRKLAAHHIHTLVGNNKQVIVKRHLPTAKTNTYILWETEQEDSGPAHGISYSAGNA